MGDETHGISFLPESWKLQNCLYVLWLKGRFLGGTHFVLPWLWEEVRIFCTYMISLKPGMYFDWYTCEYTIDMDSIWKIKLPFRGLHWFHEIVLVEGSKKHMGKAETSINRFALSIDTQHRHTAPTVYRGHLFQAIICFFVCYPYWISSVHICGFSCIFSKSVTRVPFHLL